MSEKKEEQERPISQIDDDVEFLRAFGTRLAFEHEMLHELQTHEFSWSDEPATSAEGERAARLADKNGFDGNVFRELFAPLDENERHQQAIRDIGKRIESIPRIIQAIEDAEYEPSRAYGDSPPGEIVAVLPKRLKEIFTFLWTHRNCQLSEIECSVWKDKPVTPDAIRKAIDRLRDRLPDGIAVDRSGSDVSLHVK